MTDDDTKLDIDWVKTIAGALAAVSTAVLLSTLGAAGTLIGAALGSVAVTVTSQLYAQGLARSRAKMAKAQEVALHKVGVAQAEVRRAGRRQGDDEAVEAHLGMADERLDQARSELDEAAPSPSLRERLVVLPWKRIALLAATTFVIVLLAIAAFEAVTGRSISSLTGGSDQGSGSTFTDVGGRGASGDDRDQDRGPKDTQDPSGQPGDSTVSPSDEPEEEPTEEPTDEPTQEPEETTVPTPTELPSQGVSSPPAP